MGKWNILHNKRVEVDELEDAVKTSNNLLVMYTCDEDARTLCVDCGIELDTSKGNLFIVDDATLTVLIVPWNPEATTLASTLCKSPTAVAKKNVHVQLPQVDYDASYDTVMHTYLSDNDGALEAMVETITVYTRFVTHPSSPPVGGGVEEEELFESDIFLLTN
jgi:hypothetical protein